ncbi:MAG TPA: SapC family protein [Steroidobacteraceae bacterium]|nr:SapC family protein [Steroidobacteraceae bacterium]
MAQHAQLNNVDHHDLRVLQRFGAQYGDNVATVLTFPTEFGDVQREYPIFFRKDKTTGEYHSLVLLGFQEGENLFLEDGRWNAKYIPGMISRGPFLIGFQEQQAEGGLRREPVIHVDLDHPRLSRTEGQPLFLPKGGSTPYLEHMAKVLRAIHEGLEVQRAMFAAFTALDLIEPVKLDIQLSETEKYAVEGLNTIDQVKLSNLEGDALLRLHRSGFLQGAYLVAQSLSNVNSLMQVKQRRNLAGAAAASASH